MNFQKGKLKISSLTSSYGLYFNFPVELKTKQNKTRKKKNAFFKISVSQSDLLAGFLHLLLKHVVLVTAGKRVLQQTNDWFDAIWQFL